MGHVFIVHGDLRKICCDAWLLPCDVRAIPHRHWLEWPAEAAASLPLPVLPSTWSPDGLRTLKVADWPAGYPQPWLTIVGADRMRTLEWFIHGAVQFVDEAARDLVGAASRCGPRARPLLALPVVGTGYGGAESQAGDVVRLLIPALADAAKRHQLDIVLMCFDDHSFAAAQAHRRGSADAWPELGPALRSQGDKLARVAARGDLVMFLGAGVSTGAGLPQWGELIEQLASEIGIPAQELPALRRLDYMDQAHILEQRCGNEDLLRHKIAGALRRSHYALGHGLLASLPVSEIVTTNYDQLFEMAYTSAGNKTLAVLPHAPQPGATGWLLKMHGSIEQPRDIVLTRRDYLRYDEQRAALSGIVQAQLITKQMMFVGFSMNDANFMRIADAVRRALRAARPTEQQPQAFGVALALAKNPLLEELWRHDLSWVAMEEGDEGAPRFSRQAARRLDIFLDYLLAQASSTTTHLLDHRFDGVLTESERALRTALETFLSTTPPAARKAPAWAQVEDLIRQLGGFPVPTSRRRQKVVLR